MTRKDNAVAEKADQMSENLVKLEELSQRFLTLVQNKQAVAPALSGPGPDLMVKASHAYWEEAVKNPARLMAQQVEYWGKSLSHFATLQQNLGGMQSVGGESSATNSDPRFSNPMWQSHPYFSFVKDQYLQNAAALRSAARSMDGLAAVEQKRLSFFTDQIIDMMAPTNFLGTNPDALERAIETDGQSLIDGLENLISDLEDNQGELVVKLANDKVFELGVNIANSPGKVVFENRMFELLQYSPSSEVVHAIPLLIFPPWINKFYVLDLKAQNSLIKWLTEQGFSVFVVSWVNPDDSYRDVGLETYIEDGFLTAIREVKARSAQSQVNAVGYCIGGTTLALTLALLKKRGDSSVNSASFFTTLTDFSQQGEFTPFLQNDFIDGIEQEVAQRGMLKSFVMARTFSFLRANDLIYKPAIKSYMMGEAPPAFDLLFWNGDGTNLPGRMAVQYLRELCQSDAFATQGITLLGERLHLKDVKVPVCAIGCETDHIAAWKDSYRGVQGMGSRSKQFILSQSGHIAGIINPPSKKKYGHFTNQDLTLSSDQWQKTADFNSGSWWPSWSAWLTRRYGKKIAARHFSEAERENLPDAPGRYVRL
jgi:polyhydroxyalkanoate synthase